jgi:hypothetical protein
VEDTAVTNMTKRTVNAGTTASGVIMRASSTEAAATAAVVKKAKVVTEAKAASLIKVNKVSVVREQGAHSQLLQ